jgi:hypothetical protein
MCVTVFVSYARIVYPANLRRSVFVAPFLVSPAAMLIIRFTLESGQPSVVRYPTAQAWALDLIILGTQFLSYALQAANYAWPGDYDSQGYFSGKRWFWIALASGIAVATIWNLVVDIPGYIQRGHGELLGSPSHLWLMWVVFPVFAGALINYGLPVVFRWSRSRWTWQFLVAVLVLGLLLLVDGSFLHLNPRDIFPAASQTWLASN